jgi:hypothetical protein
MALAAAIPERINASRAIRDGRRTRAYTQDGALPVALSVLVAAVVGAALFAFTTDEALST